MFSLCNHMQSHAILKREKYLAYIRQIGITQAFSMCFSECLGDWATEHSDVVYFLTLAGFPQTLSWMLVECKIYLISDKKMNDSFLKSISRTQVRISFSCQLQWKLFFLLKMFFCDFVQKKDSHTWMDMRVSKGHLNFLVNYRFKGIVHQKM